MRNTTTLIVIVMLSAASALAQPEPFPATTELTVTYPNTPSASGVYTFAFDTDQYLHNGSPDSFGTIEWHGPFTPQSVTGRFVHADDGFLIHFSGRWWPDGTFIVLSAPHPSATMTGTSVPEPTALALLPLALLLRNPRRK